MACLRAKSIAVIGLCLIAGVAGAKPGTPGPDYFAGSFERVGRDAMGAFLNDIVQIVPAGAGLTVTSCSGASMQMNCGPAFEIVNLMTGSQGADTMECLFHNNGYNAPILTCRSAAGTAITLWPTSKTMSC